MAKTPKDPTPSTKKVASKSPAKKAAAKPVQKTAKPAAKAAAVKKVAKAAKPAAEKKAAAPKAAAVKKPAAKKTATKAVAEKKPAAKKAASPKKAAAAGVAKKPAVKKTTAPKKAGAATPVRKSPARKAAAKVVPVVAPVAKPVTASQSVRPVHAPPPPSEGFERELPQEYGDTKIVALVRDPEWIYLYWEINAGSRAHFGIQHGHSLRTIALRIYDVTDRHFDGTNAHSFFDIKVDDRAAAWYLRIPESNRSYVVDLGVYDEEGNFLVVARSNSISVPPSGMSNVTDEQWMNITDEHFAEIFRMSGGLRLQEMQAGSAGFQRPPVEVMVEALRRQWVSSGPITSGAFSSAGAAKPSQKKKGFWLEVGCDVIIYGATEPDATVTLQGKPIQLSPDGTFTARFAFPDGTIEMPVVATNKDGDDTRRVTPVVNRKTK